MASISNTNISSYDYILRNCYSSNRLARKSYNRATLKNEELATADSAALKKVTKNLKDMEYTSDNGMNIYNNVKAFVEAYNNLSNSSEDIPTLAHTEKNLKKFVKDHKDELEDIGIKISTSGELKLDKETIMASSSSKLKKIFSSEGTFSSGLLKLATRINRYAKSIEKSGNSNKNTTTALEDLPLTVDAMSSTSIDFRA